MLAAVGLAGTCHKFAVGCRIGIVCQKDRQVQLVLEHPPDGDILEVQVAGEDDLFFLVVHNARTADADRFNLVKAQPCLFDSGSGGLRHGVGNLLGRSADIGFVTCLGQKMELLVHHARDDVGSAKVDSDIIFHAGMLLPIGSWSRAESAGGEYDLIITS